MVARKNQTALLKKLKKQVRLLQRKEERSRNQLKAALKNASKLTTKIRVMKGLTKRVSHTAKTIGSVHKSSVHSRKK